MTTKTRSMIPAAAAVALLLVAAPSTGSAQQRGRVSTGEPLRTPSDVGLHGYSVVLVIGDMTAASAADTVPPAARKALTDMQAFLPYKRYQLLDAAWMVCCGSFRSTLAGRVRGPENGEYLYTIDTLNSIDDSKLTVRFSMRDASTPSVASVPLVTTGRVTAGAGGRGSGRGSSPTAPSNAEARDNLRIVSDSLRAEQSRQLYETTKQRDEAVTHLRNLQQRFTETHPQVVEAMNRFHFAQARLEELQQSFQHLPQGGGGGRGTASSRTIMDSTFSIALGETVVIGTSRLKGDQALIALLTAARKPGAAR